MALKHRRNIDQVSSNQLQPNSDNTVLILLSVSSGVAFIISVAGGALFYQYWSRSRRLKAIYQYTSPVGGVKSQTPLNSEHHYISNANSQQVSNLSRASNSRMSTTYDLSGNTMNVTEKTMSGSTLGKQEPTD